MAAAQAVIRALGVESPQVAIDFFNNAAAFIWHHRFLLVKLGGRGTMGGRDSYFGGRRLRPRRPPRGSE